MSWEEERGRESKWKFHAGPFNQIHEVIKSAEEARRKNWKYHPQKVMTLRTYKVESRHFTICFHYYHPLLIQLTSKLSAYFNNNPSFSKTFWAVMQQNNSNFGLENSEKERTFSQHFSYLKKKFFRRGKLLNFHPFSLMNLAKKSDKNFNRYTTA